MVDLGMGRQKDCDVTPLVQACHHVGGGCKPLGCDAAGRGQGKQGRAPGRGRDHGGFGVGSVCVCLCFRRGAESLMVEATGLPCAITT